ncbi:hypothetical protein [Janthinobacterium fluminis]|uniref:Uncharacterized protein n=1 Tax=Janthinobacterium fluminis TaxID=2987524 RepID=A0ABT5JXK7_9BURK|nr:hypothetical protein [Janthinobacterium fluminis]MDC8757478.1 hypothetical protein [Janthinobacterium fluminis]
MPLYILDKNIVEDIRKSLVDHPSVELARSVDIKGNSVSPILSIAEGRVRRPQGKDEMHNSLLNDTRLVESFYKNARTDTEFLKHFGMEMIETFGVHWEEKASILMPIVKELQVLLARTYSLTDAKDIFMKIDSLRQRHRLNRRHPLVACAVACLYGNLSARKVLKPAHNPEEGDSYNAVADIRMLMETAYIRQMVREIFPLAEVNLLSSDKGLNEFARESMITADASTPFYDLNVRIVDFKATITDELFPFLKSKPKNMIKVKSYFSEGA